MIVVDRRTASLTDIQCPCFPRGLISLNTSVSYLIEPLHVSTDAQQHAVFRAESLKLPRGSCLHHHGNMDHEERLGDFIHGIISPHRVSSDRTNSNQLPDIGFFSHKAWHYGRHIFCSELCCFYFQEKRDLSQTMKYVELLIVADKAEVRKQLRICSYLVT